MRVDRAAPAAHVRAAREGQHRGTRARRAPRRAVAARGHRQPAQRARRRQPRIRDRTVLASGRRCGSAVDDRTSSPTRSPCRRPSWSWRWPARCASRRAFSRCRRRCFAWPARGRDAARWSSGSLDTLEVDTAAFRARFALDAAVLARRRHGARVAPRRAAIIAPIMLFPIGRPHAPTSCAPLRFTRGFTRHAEGSVLVEMGDTRVLCTVSVEEGVPALHEGPRPGVADRRIRHASARDAYARPARGERRAGSRAARRRSSGSSGAACAR